MPDNIMGGDSDVSLGLNLDIQMGKAVQDASVLADQFKTMVGDATTLNSILSDTSAKLQAMVTSRQQEASASQQLLSLETELRNIGEQRLGTVQQTVNQYEKMEQIVGRIALIGSNAAPSPGGGGGASVGAGGGRRDTGGTSGVTFGPSGGGSLMPEGSPTQELNASPAVGGAGGAGGIGAISRLLRPIIGGVTGDEDEGGGGGAGSSLLQGVVLTKVLERIGSGATGDVDALGGLRSIASSIAPLAVPVGIAAAGYGVVRGLAQQAQQYSSLTGGTNIGGGVGYNLQAALLSGFGLNPVLPTHIAREIIQNGLAQGFGPTALQGQYTQFGAQQYEKYGVSPQESMDLFLAGVVQAGASTAALSSAMDNLAGVATNTGGSFTAMRQNFVATTATLSGIAGQNPGVVPLAGGLATEFSIAAKNDPALQNILNRIPGGGSALLNTLQGQALLSQQLGIPVTALPGYLNANLGTAAGNNRVLGAYNQAAGSFFAQLGIKPGETAKQIYEGTTTGGSSFQALAAGWYTMTGQQLNDEQLASMIAQYDTTGALTQKVIQAQQKANAGTGKPLVLGGSQILNQAEGLTKNPYAPITINGTEYAINKENAGLVEQTLARQYIGANPNTLGRLSLNTTLANGKTIQEMMSSTADPTQLLNQILTGKQEIKENGQLETLSNYLGGANIPGQVTAPTSAQQVKVLIGFQSDSARQLFKLLGLTANGGPAIPKS